MRMKGITVSSGITKFKKDQILHALIHNHRLENSHRNIKNLNTNFCYDIETGKQKKIIIPSNKEEARAEARERGRGIYQHHLDKQMELMIKRNEAKGVSKPKKKDLKPIAEGVVNFGGVYDILTHTNEERIKRTDKFHKSYTEEEWSKIFHQIKLNIEKFCAKTNQDLIDISFHTDEEGIYHMHYLVTNYNRETGEGLNVRHNKNGIGDMLQDIVCEGMEEWGMGRAKGRKNKKKMTKEELIAMRDSIDSANNELEQKQEELRVLEQSVKDCQIEASKIVFILNHFIDELSQIDPNDKYGAKSKIEKLLKTSQWAIGKGKMDVAQSKLDHLEKILKAMDKKTKSNTLTTKLDNLRDK